MFKFRIKKYLKRTDFMNSVDTNKIWSKKVTIPETLDIIEQLENELANHKFKKDNNFLVNQRRKGLKETITNELLTKKNMKNINNVLPEALFIFLEYVNDEYAGDVLYYYHEFGLPRKDFYKMDNKYRKKGIICLQEKNIILNIMNYIKYYIKEYKQQNN